MPRPGSGIEVARYLLFVLTEIGNQERHLGPHQR